MLGLGWVLGEIVVVLVILCLVVWLGIWLLFDGGYMFVFKIVFVVLEFSELLLIGVYILVGFVLFVLMFLVNVVVCVIVGGKVNG